MMNDTRPAVLTLYIVTLDLDNLPHGLAPSTVRIAVSCPDGEDPQPRAKAYADSVLEGTWIADSFNAICRTPTEVCELL